MITRCSASFALVLALLSSFASRAGAQASIPSPTSATGADVRLEVSASAVHRNVRGELLAVDSSAVWVVIGGDVTTVPRDSIRGVYVRVHRWGRKRAWMIGGIGAAATGAGMTIACSSAEDAQCGGVFFAVAGIWTLITTVSGEFMESNTWSRMPLGRWSRLATYARYPQGVPASVTAEPLPFRRQ